MVWSLGFIKKHVIQSINVKLLIFWTKPGILHLTKKISPDWKKNLNFKTWLKIISVTSLLKIFDHARAIMQEFPTILWQTIYLPQGYV